MAKAAQAQEVSFEHGMEKLQEIVEQMEARDLPLEDILKKYEQGMKLIELCGQKLEAAEKKILLLTQSGAGKTQTREIANIEQLSSLKSGAELSTLDEDLSIPNPPSLF